MRADVKSRIIRYPVILAVLLTASLFISSCRTDEPEVPPLTGPSGARLFITMEARPDHLVMHRPGRPRETSLITLALKNQFGQGVDGENVKLRITNRDGVELNIGRLSDYNVTTDSAGFATTTYIAPDSSEQPVATRVYVLAILTNPAYVNEVTDRHALDLELSSAGTGDCEASPFAPVADFVFTPDPIVIFETVCFDASVSTDSNGRIVDWDWDFGDGRRGSGEVACHSYRHTGLVNVTLTVHDDDGNCDSVTRTIDVTEGTAPTCSVTAVPSDPELGEAVTFIADAEDAEGDIDTYTWNFGDGSVLTTTGNTVTHAYTDAGSFTVVLVVTDSQGDEGICSVTVNVESEAPTCVISTNPDPPSGNSPLLVNFDGTGSSDDTGIDSFEWDFGDGSTSTSPAVSHVFTATCTAPCADTFVVSLTVTDEDDNQTTCSVTVTANNP